LSNKYTLLKASIKLLVTVIKGHQATPYLAYYHGNSCHGNPSAGASLRWWNRPFWAHFGLLPLCMFPWLRHGNYGQQRMQSALVNTEDTNKQN